MQICFGVSIEDRIIQSSCMLSSRWFLCLNYGDQIYISSKIFSGYSQSMTFLRLMNSQILRGTIVLFMAVLSMSAEPSQCKPSEVLITEICRPCMQGCAKCSDNANECAVCADDYLLTANKTCERFCDEPCLPCPYPPYKCTRCVIWEKVCYPCPPQRSTECKIMKAMLAQNGNKTFVAWKQCKLNEYFGSTGKCHACSDYVKDCETCGWANDYFQCHSCKPGNCYSASDNLCFAGPSHCTQCMSGAENKCTKCETGFVLQPDATCKRQCSVQGCAECSDNANQCSVCETDYKITANLACKVIGSMDYLVMAVRQSNCESSFSVYLASKDKQLFAIKVYFQGASKGAAFEKEVEFLSKLNFEHLINIVDSKLEGRVNISGSKEEIRPIIVMEFAEGGELFEYISKQGKLKAEICRAYFKMLISAIQYLDSVGVAHRDLKPENILFDKNFCLKVSDFGLSTVSEGHQGDGVLYTKLGTVGYKPPEMQKGMYSGLQADLFAAGVILFVMYAGSPPFLSTKQSDKIYKLISSGNYAKFWALHDKKRPAGFFPDSLKRLLNSFFTAQVQKRPTFQMLKEDEWLNQDEAMQNEICAYMKEKHEKMVANDANKQKIELAKIAILQQTIMEAEEGCIGSRPNGLEVMKCYEENQELRIDDLPMINKQKIVPLKKSPALVLVWLKQYLKQAQKQKQCFTELPYESINIERYGMTFDQETKKVSIEMIFDVDDRVEVLKFTGSLVQLPGKMMGIKWEKEEGNTFWLMSIIASINRGLRAFS